MELKFSQSLLDSQDCLRSNRTFMELKFALPIAFIVWNVGSNRTFMELKLLTTKCSTLSVCKF